MSWAGGVVRDNDRLSFVFSWDLWKWVRGWKNSLKLDEVEIGGPAVVLNRDWVPGEVKVGEYLEGALSLHNSLATRTTKGCPRRCSFCGVSRIHPEFEELRDWEVKPVLVDDNLLASSKKHFDKVIDGLKRLDWCDFNQGLDVRLLTKHHARRLAELKKPRIRLSFDSVDYEERFVKAFELLRGAGIPRYFIRVYVLLGYNDSPDDSLYRLRLVKDNLKVVVNPLRYNPLDTKKRNSFVGENWTSEELIRYMRYWARLRYHANIPFEDFQPGWNNRKNSFGVKSKGLGLVPQPRESPRGKNDEYSELFSGPGSRPR